MIKSNTEKQARFRKKEILKRRAGEIFRELQLGMWNLNRTITPEEIQQNLDSIIELPSDWTESDYERAWQNLHGFQNDLRFSQHLLENDVNDSRNVVNEFMITPDPGGLIKGQKDAVENTQALASHIISALKLSTCTDSDKAAALMEVVRFIGRTLANHNEIPSSKATAMCLATIGPEYERPKWFVEKLVETLGWQVGKDMAREVGKRLMKFKN
jgi:hypothetical protein